MSQLPAPLVLVGLAHRMGPVEKIQDLGYLAVEAPDQVIAQLGAAMADVQVTAAAAVIAVITWGGCSPTPPARATGCQTLQKNTEG